MWRDASLFISCQSCTTIISKGLKTAADTIPRGIQTANTSQGNKYRHYKLMSNMVIPWNETDARQMVVCQWFYQDEKLLICKLQICLRNHCVDNEQNKTMDTSKSTPRCYSPKSSISTIETIRALLPFSRPSISYLFVTSEWILCTRFNNFRLLLIK